MMKLTASVNPDDDDYLHTLDSTSNVGVIQLDIWTFYITSVARRPLEHHHGGQVLEDELLHERTKKAGAHHVM